MLLAHAELLARGIRHRLGTGLVVVVIVGAFLALQVSEVLTHARAKLRVRYLYEGWRYGIGRAAEQDKRANQQQWAHCYHVFT